MNTPPKATEGRRKPRKPLPSYEFHRFRCPQCQGVRFKMRSRRSGDESMQYRTCKSCGFHFVLFVI